MQSNSSKFYSSLGLLIVLNAVIKPLWIFAIDRQVQNAVGTTAYGTYFSLFNLSLVFSFLLDWGFTTFVNQQMAADVKGIADKSGSFLFIKLLFVLLYGVVIFSAAAISGIDRWDLVIGVIMVQAFSSLFLFFRAIITARQWFWTDAWLSVLDKTLMILLCGSLLFLPGIFGTVTVQKFLWVQSACTALAMSIALIILLHRRVAFSIDRVGSFFNKQLIRSVLPYAAITLLMSVHFRLDGFLLERIHPGGAYEAGMYAAAYRLLDAGNMIGLIFSSFALPYMARQYSLNKPIGNVVLNIRHLLLPLSIGVAAMAIFLAPWIQQLLYHHTSVDMTVIFQWCLPALIGYSLVNIYGTAMTATGHIRAFGAIMLAAVLINIVLNFLLIPSMGAKGCCIAALTSELLCGFALVVYCKWKLKVPIDRRSLAVYLFIAGLTSTIIYFGNQWMYNSWLVISLAGALTIFTMFSTGLFKNLVWRRSMNKPHL